MGDVYYDEDLGASAFLAALRPRVQRSLTPPSAGAADASPRHGLVLCVPRASALPPPPYPPAVLDAHILQDKEAPAGDEGDAPSAAERTYWTADGRRVIATGLGLAVLAADGQAEDRTARVLFEELHYEGANSFRVLCLDQPLTPLAPAGDGAGGDGGGGGAALGAGTAAAPLQHSRSSSGGGGGGGGGAAHADGGSLPAAASVVLPSRKSLHECRDFLSSFPENSSVLRALDEALLNFGHAPAGRHTPWPTTVNTVRQFIQNTHRVRVSVASAG